MPHLQDNQKTLHQCNISSTSRLLVSAGAQAAGSLQRDEQRQSQLDKIKKVLQTMSKRVTEEDDRHSFVLENQAGEKVNVKESDRQAITQGMLLHDMGKAAMRKVGDKPHLVHCMRCASGIMSRIGWYMVLYHHWH